MTIRKTKIQSRTKARTEDEGNVQPSSGVCACGCGAPTRSGRRFSGLGHDSRLRAVQRLLREQGCGILGVGESGRVEKRLSEYASKGCDIGAIAALDGGPARERAHWWLIDRAAGPTSLGVCKTCGEERSFDNAGPQNWQDAATAGKAAEFLRVLVYLPRHDLPGISD